MDKLLPLLENCALFKNKSTATIERLLSGIDHKTESFEESRTVFSTVQSAKKIGVILSGSVDIQKIFPNGKIVIIERKKSPDIIGEAGIFSKYEYYPDNIITCKPSKMLFISKNDLLHLFAADHEFMLNFLELLSDSMMMLKHKIGILSLDSIQEKIAGYLIHDIQHWNKSNNSNAITLPFSKKAWAEYMNVSRTSLSRELRTLETQGIISFKKTDN